MVFSKGRSPHYPRYIPVRTAKARNLFLGQGLVMKTSICLHLTTVCSPQFNPIYISNQIIGDFDRAG